MSNEMPATSQDCIRWYRGCYAVLDGKTVCLNTVGDQYIQEKQVRSITEDRYEHVGYYIDRSIYEGRGSWDETSGPVRWSDLDLTFPKLGAVNIDGVVLYFTRKHKVHADYRHKKAPNPWSFDIFCPNSPEIDAIRHSYPHISFIANAIYEMPTHWAHGLMGFHYIVNQKEYPTADEAFRLVNSSQCLSVAFNRQYYFAINNNKNSIYLYRNKIIIGRYKRATNTISIVDPLFLNDLITNHKVGGITYVATTDL